MTELKEHQIKVNKKIIILIFLILLSTGCVSSELYLNLDDTRISPYHTSILTIQIKNSGNEIANFTIDIDINNRITLTREDETFELSGPPYQINAIEIRPDEVRVYRIEVDPDNRITSGQYAITVTSRWTKEDKVTLKDKFLYGGDKTATILLTITTR